MSYHTARACTGGQEISIRKAVSVFVRSLTCRVKCQHGSLTKVSRWYKKNARYAHQGAYCTSGMPSFHSENGTDCAYDVMRKGSLRKFTK